MTFETTVMAVAAKLALSDIKPEVVEFINLSVLPAHRGHSDVSGRIRTKLKTFGTPCRQNARRNETNGGRSLARNEGPTGGF